MEFIQRVKPHQIYAAGDSKDPHGTHRLSLRAVSPMCLSWKRSSEIYRYRGAWQEWVA